MAGLSTVGVPEVAPDAGAAPYQRTSASAASFGGQTAAALQDLGQTGLKVADYFADVQVDDQANQLFDRWNKRLRGDASQMVAGPDGQMQPDTGYMGLRGRNALDHRASFETELDKDEKEIRQSLVSPRQQAKFDDQTRRYRQYVLGLAGSHADSEAKTYATNVNRSSSAIALTHIANNSENIDEVKHGLSDLINSKIKEAQLLGGGTELMQAAKEDAVRSGTQTWLQAISARNPQRALDELERNKAAVGPLYDNLHREFRSRADVETGNKAGERAVLATYTTHAPAATVIPVFEQAAAKSGVSSTYLMRTWQIESGGRLDPKDSETGAQGPFQFLGTTAKQYGLTNPKDFTASANAEARLAADNKAQLTASLNRVPTDAEIYIAHQQGAGGAAKLLNNPTVRAGDLVGDRAIRVNGGDPNAPAANFTSMWAAKFNGGGALSQNLSSRKQQAYDSIESDPSLNDAQRQRARGFINQQFQALQIAEGVTAQAKKDANDQAADKHLKVILSRDPKVMAGLYDQIVSDPDLDWRTRNALSGMAEKAVGDDVHAAAQTYGPGYWSAFQNIAKPVGDPGRITDVTQLMEMAGPNAPEGGRLTVAGVNALAGNLNAVKKTPDAQAIHSAQVGLMAFAKGKLSFAQDLGPVKIPDPQGELIFNGEFIPKFNAAYAAHVAAGKNPWEFLTRENVEKMATGMRSRAKMESDRLNAMGNAAPEDKNAPPPAAPAGVDAKAWTKIVGTPLVTTDGKPFPKKVLADRLNILIANPTQETIDVYNASEFSKRLGIDGKKLLEQLGVVKPTKEPEKPLPPGANAPHNLLRRAVGLAPTEAKP